MTQKFQNLGYKDDVKKPHVSKGKCWEKFKAMTRPAR